MASEGLDILVVNYKTAWDLQGFLESLHAFPPSCPFTVTIGNVSPEPADRGVAIEWDVKCGIRTLEWEENIGYARAVNALACETDHEVLGIFNSDISFYNNNCLDLCYEDLVQNPKWAVVGPRQVNQFNQLTHGGILGTNMAPNHRAWMQVDINPALHDLSEAVTVSGSAYFTKRSIWEEMDRCPIYREFSPNTRGPFLETPHYYEETYYSYHARAHGYSVMYEGRSVLEHRWHGASARGGWADSQMPISREIFRSACAMHGIPCD